MRLAVSQTPSNTPSNTPTITPSSSSCPIYQWYTNIKLFECNYGQGYVGLPLTGWTMEHSGITYSDLTTYDGINAATWCNVPIQAPFVGASYIFNLTTIPNGWTVCNQNIFYSFWNSFEVILTSFAERLCYSLTECVLEYNATINYYLDGVLQHSQEELIQFTEYQISENPNCPLAYTMFNQVMMFEVDIIRATPTPTATQTMTPTMTPTSFEVCPTQMTINKITGAWTYPDQSYYRQTSYTGGTFTGGYMYFNGSTTTFVPGASPSGITYSVYGTQSGSTYYTLLAYTSNLSTYNWTVFATSNNYYTNQGTVILSRILNSTASGTTTGGITYPNPGRQDTGWANVIYPSVCPTLTPTATQNTTPTNTPTNTTTPTNTPTPTATPIICELYNVSNTSELSSLFYHYTDCNGNVVYQEIAVGGPGQNFCAILGSVVKDSGMWLLGDAGLCYEPTPTPTTTTTPSPTPFVVECLTGFIEGSYSGLTEYVYPNQPISTSVDNYIRFDWEVRDRPNRFTVYESSILRWTSGWVGQANYTGPWGASLNTAVFGSAYICFQSTSGRYVKVEAGAAAPTPPQLTDAYGYNIVCLGSCSTPTPTVTSTPTQTPSCPYYISNIYDDECTLIYSNVIVSPNITSPTLNYYYRGSGLGDGTIVQFLSVTCEFAEYFTTIISGGSFTCPPPI